MFEAWERKRVYVVSQANELESIAIIEFESEYVVSQATELLSIDVEIISGLSFSRWSLPIIVLYVPPIV